MKHIVITIVVVLFTLTGCDYIRNYDKPHLELSGSGPYVLNVTDFPWSYGLIGFNEFNGDFDKLDEKVYTLLQGKNGVCQVYIEQKGTDKYGNSNSALHYFGNINIDELNKYQGWQYWHKAGGVQAIIYSHLFKPTSSSATIDSPKMSSAKMTDTFKKITDTSVKPLGKVSSPIKQPIVNAPIKTFDFYKVGYAWSYYHYDNGKFEEYGSNDDGWYINYRYWERFIDSIESISIKCYKTHANMNINVSGEFHAIDLDLVGANIYESSIKDLHIHLDATNDNDGILYFHIDDKCTAVESKTVIPSPSQ
jgi:hypothetical protein